MSTDYVSADGHWRVRAIVLDGSQYLRVEHDSPVVDGRLIYVVDAQHRNGPVRTGRGWWLIGDMTTVEQVEEYVPLHRLTQANPER